MTQIISGIYKGTIFQVSDRLLSRVDTGAPVHNRANKALVVQGGRAGRSGWSISFAGYSGVATMRPSAASTPVSTDEWIAGAISTVPELGWQRPPRRTDLASLTVGLMVQRLKAHLELHLVSLPPTEQRQFVLTIQVAGYHDRRGRAEPHVFVIETRNGCQPKVRHLRITATYGNSPAFFATPELHDLQWDAFLRRLLRGPNSPSGVVDTLNGAVRALASERDGIGEDLTTLCFSGPTPHLWIDFTRADGSTEVLDAEGLEVPVVYTPWFLLPQDSLRPKVVSRGEGRIGAPPFDVSYSAEEGPTEAGFVWMELDQTYRLTDGRIGLTPGTRVVKRRLAPGSHRLEVRRRPTD